MLGTGEVRHGDEGPRFEFDDCPLADPRMLPSAVPGSFLVRPKFRIQSDDAPDGLIYARASGLHDLKVRFGLDVADVVPDLVQVIPSGTPGRAVLPSGEVVPIAGDDPRGRLRVVDIKMTAEPGAAYFAEVTYYSMALAGWLADGHRAADGRRFSDLYVVVPEAAIWPGSHELSALTRLLRASEAEGRVPTTAEKLAAWCGELEETVFDAFRFRVDTVIREVLPEVLSVGWQDLKFHVTPSCRNCEYLGYPWQRRDGSRTCDDRHCWPTAERGEGHLSRIPRLSRGAVEALDDAGHGSVARLAALPHADPAFDRHQGLRTARGVLSHRAASLRDGSSGVSPVAGTSASMPRFVNLRIFVTASFDVSSALTSSFGASGSWYASLPGRPETAAHKRFDARVSPSEFRDPEVEFRALRQFLADVSAMLGDADIRRWQDAHRDPCRMQVYVWDRLTYDHLCRVVGRHLPRLLQLDGLKSLAWLFPSEELLPNPDHASRASPVTIVEGVVRAAVGVPVPHHYSLLGVARAYHPDRVANAAALLNVHPMFEDKLSDQIPSERTIEIWQRKPEWSATLGYLRQTVVRQHTALSLVVERLEADLELSPAKLTASLIGADAAAREPRMSLDGHLWYTFARLNDAMEALEADEVRAMPVHEREARARSARLPRRLTGDEEAAAYARLGLNGRPGRRAYSLADTSVDVSVRDGDMGFALAPAALPGFLDRSFRTLAERHGVEIRNGREYQWKMAEALSVTPVRLDRENRVLVVDETRMRPGVLDELEAAGAVDLSADVVLDPVHNDFFTKPLRDVLNKLGRPREAFDNPLVAQATGQAPAVPRRFTASSPLSRFLWRAREQAAAARPALPAAVWRRLDDGGVALNTSQRRALAECLGRGLHLVWGPPGTGKSHTLAATIAAALLHAEAEGRPMRILVTAFTWSAIDNLLKPAFEHADQMMPGLVRFARLTGRGPRPVLPDGYPPIIVGLDRHAPSEEILDLRRSLTTPEGGDLIVVGATPNQVANLMRVDHARGKEYMDELFDLIVVDEASQLDVGHATLAVAALAEGGQVVCAGDPLQMAPIHKAEPPKGLEDMVGSVYLFLRDRHGVGETQLTTNYRSNAEVVECSRGAGYGDDLRAHSPALRLRLREAEGAAPEGWPQGLAWTPAVDEILDPEKPVSCLLHSDGVSAQSSDFEARLVVGLVRRLWDRLIPGLAGEMNPDGSERGLAPPGSCDAPDFWARRVGIVTPHRAQQGLIVGGLAAAFGCLGHDPRLIRSAVDTVERFQGQQRDVMLASYAVGDPDTVADEEEFLHSLNRFNVMASRARAKLVVVATRELVGHLSDDIEVVRASRMLKHFAEAHCGNRAEMRLRWTTRGGAAVEKPASFRWA